MHLLRCHVVSDLPQVGRSAVAAQHFHVEPGADGDVPHLDLPVIHESGAAVRYPLPPVSQLHLALQDPVGQGGQGALNHAWAL